MTSYENSGFDAGDSDLKRRIKPGIDMSNVDIVNNDDGSGSDEAVTTKSTKLPNKYNTFITQNRKLIQVCWILILNGLVLGYFAYATVYFRKETQEKCGTEWCSGYGLLVILMVFIYWSLFYYYGLKPMLGDSFVKRIVNPISTVVSVAYKKIYVRIITGVGIVAAFAIYIYFDTYKKSDVGAEKLRSLGAILIIFTALTVFSAHPRKIKWRPVIMGFVFQFILGLICIRWETGRQIFECLGTKIETFLNFTREGAIFVFQNMLVDLNIFAFSVMPTIIFFSFCISILYYLGAMQWFILKLGWILQSIIGTTVCESVTAAANIFLGMSESPLLIRPYITSLTRSEIHSVMTSGFATVSGTVFAAFINYGADPANLITASVMAAPAALCLSKLFYPETEESQTTTSNIKIEKSTDASILDAAANGAQLAIPIVLGIMANLIAFVSFVAFANGIIAWFGILVGFDEFSLKWIFRQMFMPLAYMLGVNWEESGYVSELIATKVIVNEFVAFELLGQFKNQSLLEPRSLTIATYAICGFANPSSVGILIGSLAVMAPNKRLQITSVAFRAFIAGTCVCFLTASIAGLVTDS